MILQRACWKPAGRPAGMPAFREAADTNARRTAAILFLFFAGASCLIARTTEPPSTGSGQPNQTASAADPFVTRTVPLQKIDGYVPLFRGFGEGAVVDAKTPVWCGRPGRPIASV